MDNALIKSIISNLVFASIFITGYGLVDVGFVVYWYYPFYLLFLIYAILIFHKVDLKLLVLFIGVVLYTLLTYDNGLNLIVKQIVNIGFSALVFYYFILHEKFDLLKIFQKYVNFSKVVLVLGLIQVIMFAVGAGRLFVAVFPFLWESSISIRLQSLAQEPSYIAFTFAPVVFCSLYNIFYGKNYFLNRRWSYLFVLGYGLTFSSVAYLGFIIILFMLYFNKFTVRKLQMVFFALGGILFLSVISYQTIEDIRIRVDDTVYGLTNDITEPKTYLRVVHSTYALLTNAYVTYHGFQEHPITGNGLGTHELLYNKYIPQQMKDYLILNSKDANSLALRLISETGLVGFVFFCVFILKYRIRKKGVTFNSEALWLINAGILVMILLSLLRSGNYTVHGKLLFFMLYYYSFKIVNTWEDTAVMRHSAN